MFCLLGSGIVKNVVLNMLSPGLLELQTGCLRGYRVFLFQFGDVESWIEYCSYPWEKKKPGKLQNNGFWGIYKKAEVTR